MWARLFLLVMSRLLPSPGKGGGAENSKLLILTWSLETTQPPPRSPRRVPPSEQKTLTWVIPRDSGHVCQELGSDIKYWDKRCS